MKAVIESLLSNNIRRAASRHRKDPGSFRGRGAGRAQKYLWIGCAEAGEPANEIVGLEPGDVFVHRNLANLAQPHDPNWLSVLQFALEAPGVEHVIVCGHYGCGGVRAALDGARSGILDHWLQPIRTVYWRHADEIERIGEPKARVNHLCERNISAQVESMAGNPLIRDAWGAGRALSVHGWIYSTGDGLLRDLGATVSDLAGADALLRGRPPAASSGGRAGRRRA